MNHNPLILYIITLYSSAEGFNGLIIYLIRIRSSLHSPMVRRLSCLGIGVDPFMRSYFRNLPQYIIVFRQKRRFQKSKIYWKLPLMARGSFCVAAGLCDVHCLHSLGESFQHGKLIRQSYKCSIVQTGQGCNIKLFIP